jgi:hypothetical protein
MALFHFCLVELHSQGETGHLINALRFALSALRCLLRC